MTTSFLRHVVLFGFTPETGSQQVAQIVTAFAALPAQIPGIVDFEWGVNVSPEGIAQGHTHCFLVTFATEAERDAYLPHPAHQAFVALLQPHLAHVLVVDYWTH